MNVAHPWLPVVLVALVWATFWKSLALWHSARRANVVWFIVLSVINTAGILDIVYLAIAGKLKPKQLFTK